MTEHKVVWEAQPGAQALAMTCPANDILMAGTRGSMKSDTQLMFYRQYVGLGYGAFWRGLIFDLSYGALDDLIKRSKRWFPQFDDGARFLSSLGQLKWVWPTGEELLFRAVTDEGDYWKLHGSEFAFLGGNEVSKYADLRTIDMLGSTNRSSFVPELHSPDPENPLPPIPLVKFHTTNPLGPGRQALKTRYVDPSPAGTIVPTVQTVFNPRTQRDEQITTTRCYLFATFRENKFLDVKYIADLMSITDENRRKAWFEGDWEISAGGAFDDLWSRKYNQVPAFRIPQAWRLSRSFDWGSSAPFSVGWWAESDGCDVMLPDGSWMRTLPGDLFRIQEWYGWSGQPNEGVRLLSHQIAEGIVEREIRWGMHGRVLPGPADSSIYDVVDGNCIGDKMAQPVKLNGKQYSGVHFVKADKSPGSRVNGFQLMRDAIFNAHPSEHGPRERPGLFVLDTCRDGFLRTVPSIPTDPVKIDDVLTTAEDHCFTGDTLVWTDKGSQRLDSLIGTQGAVMTDAGFRGYRNARLIERNQEIVAVKFEDGSVVHCTPDHLLLVSIAQWVRADHSTGLPIMKCVVGGEPGTLRVTSVEPHGIAHVYCLTVPGYGRFALANGAVVANCYDESRYVITSMGARFKRRTNTGLF